MATKGSGKAVETQAKGTTSPQPLLVSHPPLLHPPVLRSSSVNSVRQIPGAAANTGNPHYKQDADFTAAMGFDGVKFDAGGGNDNMTLCERTRDLPRVFQFQSFFRFLRTPSRSRVFSGAEAINATGRVMMLENCNNGGDVPYNHHGEGGWPSHRQKASSGMAAGAQGQAVTHNHHGEGPDGGCPFNMFRTGESSARSSVASLRLCFFSASLLYVLCFSAICSLLLCFCSSSVLHYYFASPL